MDLVLVNGIALALILFILWWFFSSKPAIKTIQDNLIQIRVKDGIYEPSQIKIPINQTVILQFIREDETPCAETVIFSQLNMAYPLALNKPTDIVIPPQLRGEIDFTCQMGMYRGRLIVG